LFRSNLPVSSHSNFNVQEWKQKCYDAMNDDFNSPILIAHLFDAVKAINLIQDGKESITQNDKEILTATLSAFVFDVLGLFKEDVNTDSNDKLENVVRSEERRVGKECRWQGGGGKGSKK